MWASLGAGSRIRRADTLVVYLGDGADARDFILAVGLDPPQTVVLTDPQDRLAMACQALPCPRVFVLDALGLLRYTNTHKDDAPPAAHAALIISQAVDALGKGAGAAGKTTQTGHAPHKNAPGNTPPRK